MWRGDIRIHGDGISQQARMLDGVEVGPSLGMVKSSSLESLHNVYKNSIKLDDEDRDSRKLRMRGASFSASSPTGGHYFRQCLPF